MPAIGIRMTDLSPVFSAMGAFVEEHPGVVERAFQVARSGRVTSMSELNEFLTAEGYAGSVQSLGGRSIQSKLSRIMAACLTASALSPPSVGT
jgi:hypothetical protein